MKDLKNVIQPDGLNTPLDKLEYLMTITNLEPHIREEIRICFDEVKTKGESSKLAFKPSDPDKCTVTGKPRKNVFTYHIDSGDGELIVTKENLTYGLECEMPSDYDMECEHDEPDEDGVIQEITIQIKKYLTQEEVDALPEKS